MSAVLLATMSFNADEWRQEFQKQLKGRALRVWPDDIGDPNDLAYACVWGIPHGALTPFPNLKAVFNLGAGVDRLLADPRLPDVPIVRAVHPDLGMRVTEYAVLHVLMHHRRQRLYDAQQRDKAWISHPQPAACEVAVGVMGLGVIGSKAATALAGLGFQVAGWSRTPRAVPGITAFSGAAGLDAFLARTKILVCVLPQTPETEGLLNLSLFRKLKRNGAAGGAFLINAGRGKVQIDADILTALDEGTLAGVTLDVFPEEPLPPQSPLWAHPKVTITPHNAGDVSPRLFVQWVLGQIEQHERGLPLENLIDRERRY